MAQRFAIVAKSIVYEGFFRLEKYRLRHELFAGGWTRKLPENAWSGDMR